MLRVNGYNNQLQKFRAIIFDNEYYKQCILDHQFVNKIYYDNYVVPQQILNVRQLQQLITQNLSFKNPLNNHQNDRRHHFDKPINYYINVKSNNVILDYNLLIQLVLAINKNIAIIYDNPKSIYWKGFIFKAISDGNTFKCCNELCKVKIRMKDDNTLYEKKDDNIHNLQCYNKNYKQIIIYDLIKKELFKLINKSQMNTTNTIHQFYNVITQKYSNRFPFLSLDNFYTFNDIKSSLYKSKKIKDVLLYHSLSEYMENENGFSKTIEQHIPFQSIRNELFKNLLYEVQNDSLIISNIKLLKLLFNAQFWAGDGTFAIRPVYKGGKKTKEGQVFKIYAIFKYIDTKGNIVYRQYLVCVAILENRTTEIYKWLFQTIKDWGKKYTLYKQMKTEQYLCDYELPQRNAFKKIFKDTTITISGEEFHYNQCLIRKIRNIGLIACYINKKKKTKNYSEEFRCHIEQFFALQHIPITYVDIFANQICSSLHEYALKTDDITKNKKIYEFVYYFLTVWIGINKDKIAKKLKLKKKDKWYEWLTKQNASRKYYKKKDWNLCGSQIRTNNSTEVLNKHHCNEVKHSPTISKLIKWILTIFDEQIRNFNSENCKKILPSDYKKKTLLLKDELLKISNQSNWDYYKFKKFSEKLTLIRYKTKYGINAEPNNRELHIEFDEILQMDDITDINHEINEECDINENDDLNNNNINIDNNDDVTDNKMNENNELSISNNEINVDINNHNNVNNKKIPGNDELNISNIIINTNTKCKNNKNINSINSKNSSSVDSSSNGETLSIAKRSRKRKRKCAQENEKIRNITNKHGLYLEIPSSDDTGNIIINQAKKRLRVTLGPTHTRFFKKNY